MTGASDVRAACGYPAKDPALDVPCPICGVAKGEPCTTLGRRRDDPHPARTDLAAEAQPTATILPFQPRET